MRFLLVLLLAAPWFGHAAEPDLLEPEKAFRFAARLARADAIEVRYQIAPGYYMYRDKFRFSVEPAEAKLGTPLLPPGKMKRDEFFGDVETYRGEVKILLPYGLDGRVVPALVLTAISQGCADVGVCYVPQEQKAELQFAAFNPATGGAFTGPVRAKGGAGELIDVPGARAQGEDTLIAELFRGEFWLLVASFFGFGLLLSFTPCVLPMVPILSGIIVGRGHHLTKTHGFLLSAAYVIGMAITYALAGVAAGLSGAMLSAALQNPWVLGGFAAVFVALALAMFGVYELQLPVALQTRLTAAANRLHGGHFAGVFAMGVLSALIVGPCVAAPLAGALLYISQSRDVALGGAALFAMGLGMGAPLLAVGASAGALVPKAGPWMETVKRFFGVLLLAVAIYLVSPLFPLVAQMLAWATLLIITAIYLHALDPLPPGAHGFRRFSKGVGVIALVAGVVFLIGALSGGRDILRPLSGLRVGESAPESAPVAFQRVNNLAALEGAIQAAAGRPVMLDFYADWCVSCKEMERYTFSDVQVRARLEQVTKLQADVTANTAEHAALLKRFSLFGPPGIIFFDRGGREIQGLRVIGFQSADKFSAVLDQVLAFQ
ncbi:MAG: thiol:disulfide interchange protein [Betaproteobacteria bacterium RIFCSPLOWO2_12_FULL_62_58]|nr:MAG: thiol:disulfide interchange protein [Betaproteobacteria bacterium RIFCSPLOWO2_02_FULL_62_79]OGA54213.1 MAG: thiol:disulfide interchange protein [Betaproteobacteria bacterium RIFCSPLOWO2_12_FULL_62_58]